MYINILSSDSHYYFFVVVGICVVVAKCVKKTPKMLMGLSNDSVKDLLGASATITTIVQFLAGSLLCYAYILKKSTGETVRKRSSRN